MKAIAAMSLNRVIGARGAIPWKLSADLRFFKRTTLGHIVVMGRKTFESIGRPLPGRENIVLSTRPDFAPDGARVVRSADDVPRATADGRDVFIIGGAELYAAFLEECDTLYLTLVNQTVEGDAFFPAFEHLFSAFEVLETGPDYEIRCYRRRE